MIKLFISGGAFDIDETKHTVAEVFELLTKHAGGKTWFFLADGTTLHLSLSNNPSYAVKTDAKS